MPSPAIAREESPVVFDHVTMRFGARPVLVDFSCHFPGGKISVVLGGSGAGKTTVLRLIGGLIQPQSGRICVAGVDVVGLTERQLYEVRRKLGMMFQGGALLNSLTVYENLAFPLREHTRLGEAEIAERVHATLAAVGLRDVDHLLPGELSGGMVKRVALARAILRDPEILLCDEPFSGLDPISVKRIEALLRRINQERKITMIVSSHHIPSTMRMAHHVVLLWDHQAVQGTPQELASSPDPQIADFFNEEVHEEGVREPLHTPVQRW